MMRRLLTLGIATISTVCVFLNDASCAERGSTVPKKDIQSMFAAVKHSETDQVRKLAEQHTGLNEREAGDQATPMIYAAGTDQWPAVEILIDHGADIWAHDKFGVTVGSFVLDSRISRGSPEDQARLRVITKLEARGFPLPPPDWQEVLDLSKAGKWPPAGAKQ